MDLDWFQTISNVFDRLEPTEFFRTFRQLRSNRERIRLIDAHRHEFVDAALDKFRQQFVDSPTKDAEQSLRCRKSGNDAFVRKDLRTAAQFYHQSIAFAPVNSRDLALAYGNLSAVLFELNLHRETIRTIDIAFDCYPEDLRSKLRLRRESSCAQLSQPTVHPNENNDVSFEESSELYRGVHQHISSTSSAVRLVSSEEKGRHLIADDEIPKDALLIKEHPYACLLPRELAMIYCDNCLAQLRLPHPCEHCSDVLFCSEECREKALNTYHRYECGQIALLHQLGIAFLAYRTLTNTDPSALAESSTRTEGNYRSICQLLSHSESMSVDDAFHYSLTGYFLLSLLEGTPYSSIDRILLGSNLVDHIEQMICNAQTMSIRCANSADQHVASAILPVCALMNHSCLPNIRCLYHQGYFHVYARRVIVQGEEICNCYGPEQALIPSTAERQRLLFDQYFFKCQCEGCRSTTAQNASLR